ncbi:MAG: terminase small subunit [Oscillospiraceae bacterium]|nr:terminase small subunit [Oscillospiraceae bacterium]
MTEKQKIFADEYLIDLNATRAYKAAYPKVKKDTVASANGSRMLRNAKIKAYIDEQLDKLHSERSASANEVIEYLTSVLRGESTSEEILTVGIGDGCSEAQNVQKRPSERERLKAAELLGKRFGIFTEKSDDSNVLQKLDDVLKQIGE